MSTLYTHKIRKTGSKDNSRKWDSDSPVIQKPVFTVGAPDTLLKSNSGIARKVCSFASVIYCYETDRGLFSTVDVSVELAAA